MLKTYLRRNSDMNKSKIKIYVIVLIQCTQWNIETVYSVRANLCLIHDILRFKVPCSQTAQTGETTLFVQYGIEICIIWKYYQETNQKQKQTPQNERFKDTVCKRLQEQKMQKVFCFFVDIYMNTPQGDILIWSMFYSYRPNRRRVILEESVCRRSQRVSNILRQQ